MPQLPPPVHRSHIHAVLELPLPPDVIALAVRWYLRFRLSYTDVVEWLAERGIIVDPSTVYDRVRTFTPRFIAAARGHRSSVGRRWRVDETSIKTAKRWHYLFAQLTKMVKSSMCT